MKGKRRFLIFVFCLSMILNSIMPGIIMAESINNFENGKDIENNVGNFQKR